MSLPPQFNPPLGLRFSQPSRVQPNDILAVFHTAPKPQGTWGANTGPRAWTPLAHSRSTSFWYHVNAPGPRRTWSREVRGQPSCTSVYLGFLMAYSSCPVNQQGPSAEGSHLSPSSSPLCGSSSRYKTSLPLFRGSLLLTACGEPCF